MQLTQLLRGHQIEHLSTNGNVLVIRCTDGREVQVAWVDDSGRPLKGTPIALFAGTNIRAKLGKFPEIQHHLQAGL